MSNHKTAIKILKKAKKIFLKNGFDGTSIRDVANECQINKSLIYHHFDSKERLWKAVKEYIIEQTTETPLENIDFSSKTLKEFLEKIVNFRFNLYAQNSDLIKLMLWQRIEKSNTEKAGIDKINVQDIYNQIEKLQANNEISKKYDSEMISYLIFSTASNCFIDQVSFIKNDEVTKRKYLIMIIDCLEKALKP